MWLHLIDGWCPLHRIQILSKSCSFFNPIAFACLYGCLILVKKSYNATIWTFTHSCFSAFLFFNRKFVVAWRHRRLAFSMPTLTPCRLSSRIFAREVRSLLVKLNENICAFQDLHWILEFWFFKVSVDMDGHFFMFIVYIFYCCFIYGWICTWCSIDVLK